MGIFGVDVYAQSRFGKDPSLSRPDFSVQPFKSLPLDYSTLFLTWALPVSTNCVQIQMVRNNSNIPQDETDGAIVLNQATRAGLSYTEKNAVIGFNYYTIFGCDSSTGVWVRCSDLIAILPVNWGAGDRMYNLLPAIYSDRDIVLVDPYNPWPNTPGSPPLQRYLGMLGFELDFIRTEMESLMMVNDARHISGALLPLLAYQLGMPYENEIGMKQARGLVENAIHLYKRKGSAAGISEYCSLLTGYTSAPTLMGHNKMLCPDDSICAQSIGTWQPWPPVGSGMPAVGGENSGLILTQVPALMAVPGMSDPTTLVGAAPPGYTAATLPGMSIKVTNASTADITTGAVPTLDFLGDWASVPNGSPNLLSDNQASLESGSVGTDWANPYQCALSTSTVRMHAGIRSLQMTSTVASGSMYCNGPTPVTTIRVVPGQTMTASAWVTAAATPEPCHVSVGFYTAASAFISAPASVEVTDAVGAWTQITVTTVVPSNAAYANIWLGVDGIHANGEIHYWDDISFFVGTLQSTLTGSTPGSVTWRFQIFTPFSTPARTVRASVVGDVSTGVPLAVTPVQSVTTVPGGWVQVTVTGTVVPPYMTVTNADGSIAVITNYYYLYPRIQIVGMAANEIHYYTLGMLWNEAPTYPTLPAYDYPRDLKVVLEPQQANLFANPLTFPPTWTHGLDGWTSLPNPAGNLLTPAQSSMEQGDTTGWTNANNTALSNSNTQSYDGLHSLRMSSLVSGSMSVVSTPDVNAVVVGGAPYTATAWVRAQNRAASAQISIRWYNAANALMGGSTLSSVSVLDTVTSWTQLSVSGNAPATAAYSDVMVTILTTGGSEVHYLDLVALNAGIVSSTTATAVLSVVPLTPGVVQPLSSPCATPTQLPPYGSGEMRVQPLTNNPVVWGGTVNTFSQAFVPHGWWTDPNNSWWGSSAAGYTASQQWIDTDDGWFMFSGDPVAGGGYFGAGLTTIGGDWFVQPQPTAQVDCLPFTVFPAQVLVYSVYARYLAVRDPSDASMVLGFRWFFPDGTYTETFSITYDLTPDYINSPYAFLGQVPFEDVTGDAATGCLPFVRFPSANPQDLFGLNGAMLSPGNTVNPFLDTRLHPGDNDYTLDSNGASYYFNRQQIRLQRLGQTLPDWVPMSATYTVVKGTGQTALSLV